MSRQIAVIGGGPAGLCRGRGAREGRSSSDVSSTACPPLDANSSWPGEAGSTSRTANPRTFHEPLRRCDRKPRGRISTPCCPRTSGLVRGTRTGRHSSGRADGSSRWRSRHRRSCAPGWPASGLAVRFALRHRFIGLDGEGRLVFENPARSVSPCTQRRQSWRSAARAGRASAPTAAGSALLADRGVPIAPLLPANMGFTVAWSEHFRQRFEGQPLKRVALSCGDRAIGARRSSRRAASKAAPSTHFPRRFGRRSGATARPSSASTYGPTSTRALSPRAFRPHRRDNRPPRFFGKRRGWLPSRSD